MSNRKMIYADEVGVDLIDGWQKVMIQCTVARTPPIDPETLPIVRELREKLERYEKAEQEGRLVELPCKIGTPAFGRYMDCEQPYKPENCIDHKGGCDNCPHRAPAAIPIQFNYVDIPRFGKTVFLSKEAALKERE